MTEYHPGVVRYHPLEDGRLGYRGWISIVALMVVTVLASQSAGALEGVSIDSLGGPVSGMWDLQVSTSGDATKVSYRIDAGEWNSLVYHEGTWYKLLDTTHLDDGTHNVTVRAQADGTDPTTVEDSVTLDVDNTPPAIQLDMGSIRTLLEDIEFRVMINEEHFETARVWVMVSGTTDITLELDRSDEDARLYLGSLDLADLSDGPHQFTVEAVDGLGNKGMFEGRQMEVKVLPDLAISMFTVRGPGNLSALEAGDEVRVEYTVTNLGHRTVDGAIIVDLRRDVELVGSQTHEDGLEPRDSFSGRFTWEVNTEKERTLRLLLDPRNDIAETSEVNNEMSVVVDVVEVNEFLNMILYVFFAVITVLAVIVFATIFLASRARKRPPNNYDYRAMGPRTGRFSFLLIALTALCVMTVILGSEGVDALDVTDVEGDRLVSGFWVVNATVTGDPETVTILIYGGPESHMDQIGPYLFTATLDTTTLDDGDHRVIVSAKNETSKEFDTLGIQITVDNTPPGLEVDWAPKGIVQSTLRVTATMDDTHPSGVVWMLLNGTDRFDLSPGEREGSFVTTIDPINLENGNYSFTVHALDAVGNEAISDTYNFSLGQLPDLQILSFDVPQGRSLWVDSLIWVNITVVNRGTAPSGPFNTTVYLESRDLSGGHPEIAVGMPFFNDTLDVNESVLLTFNWTTTRARFGDFVVHVDMDGEVLESDEGNNEARLEDFRISRETDPPPGCGAIIPVLIISGGSGGLLFGKIGASSRRDQRRGRSRPSIAGTPRPRPRPSG
jgi:hypothetical protein